VISALVYGRNDSHGYNLHRRVALSLNCLAEILRDVDDEIIFVDYNTPDELPTLIEAVADTLTGRCLSLLRVLRVPAAIHAHRFAKRTHLAAVEAVARNVAARRANTSNRWLLSTNTDMIVFPLSEIYLNDICRDLPDAYYSLPRFELPEWVWERLPRSDPRRTTDQLKLLGPKLRLDEPTLNHEWIRFDSPGDFQLILRQDFIAIDGFDEDMLLGWHVDSNLSRRLFLRRGCVESLEGRVAGYHCNHNRIATILHGNKWIANDLDRFFFSVKQADLPMQRATWGLADLDLEEVPVRERVGPSLLTEVSGSIPEASPPTPRDARDAKFASSYDSGHVLPFVIDSLVFLPPEAIAMYVGVNPCLRRMVSEFIRRAGRQRGLAVPDMEDESSVDGQAWNASIFIVDLGVDTSRIESSRGVACASEQEELNRVFETLQRLVELERERIKSGQHPRRFVLVNSSAAFWNAYVLAEMHCSPTTPHTRVRAATVRRDPDVSEKAQAAGIRALRLRRWASRPHQSAGHALHVRPGETVSFKKSDDFGGFGDGWFYPDRTGIWTEGPRASVTIATDGSGSRITAIEFRFNDIGLCHGSQLCADLYVDDVWANRRSFSGSDSDIVWRTRLTSSSLAKPRTRVTIVFEEATNWSDERCLGLHLESLTLKRAGLAGQLQEIVNESRRRIVELRPVPPALYWLRRPLRGARSTIRTALRRSTASR
jgi:hypothetical protein